MGARGEGWWGGVVREFGMDMHTSLHFKRITNKVLLYSPGDSVQCRVAAWMGGEFGEEWIRTCVRLSLLKLLQHC